ncbi:MAG: hypothetical protein D6737_03905 [Chloroflexi bacterium]|nr:MAG: hypothetical protein CUN54_00570 [Phototrophicales bacterium]RMF81789.1 MAG: hypothetical protein D6737_03905 [Chloroflexota bacterium]
MFVFYKIAVISASLWFNFFEKGWFENVNSGRVVGIILVVVGLGIALIAALFLITQLNAEDGISGGGAAVGAGLAFIPVALFVGFGAFMVFKGGEDAKKHVEMEKQRKVLDIVKSRGQVTIDDLALEIDISRDELKAIVHRLVGLQVFDGYINWDVGTLYSEQASHLHELTNCKNCGGDIDLAGQGVLVCPWCGTEYFLSS